MKCKTCQSEYDGRLKVCPNCEKEAQAEHKPIMTMGEVVEAENEKPLWQSWGQTAGGEEIIPGWILNNRTLYNIGKPLLPFALGIMRDAFQVKTENRRPVMGDPDFNIPKSTIPEMIPVKKD